MLSTRGILAGAIAIALGTFGPALRQAQAGVTYTYSTLYTFSGPDGLSPGNLAFDSNGNLYGTASTGGANGNGSIFELAAGSRAFSSTSFTSNTTGSDPVGVLAFGSGGTVYGTTGSGTPGGSGGVFSVGSGLPAGSLANIASFSTSTISFGTGVVVDSRGDIFGTTSSGGANNYGVVYEIAAGSNTFKILSSFTSSTGSPNALAMDANGNIYGTTHGGVFTGGTIFKVDPNTGSVSTIYSFNPQLGSPNSNPSFDARGNLYGATASGLIYEYNVGTGTLTSVSLSLPGYSIGNNLAVDAAGDAFGIATSGSAESPGVTSKVFEVAAGSNTPTILYSVFNADEYLLSGLAIDSQGNLYGTTTSSRVNTYPNQSTVFELSTSAVPEPASLVIAGQAIALMGVASAIRSRRSRRRGLDRGV